MKEFNRNSLHEKAMGKGYDSFVIRDAEFNIGEIDEMVIFKNDHIKSTVNKGLFSKASNSIYE